MGRVELEWSGEVTVRRCPLPRPTTRRCGRCDGGSGVGDFDAGGLECPPDRHARGGSALDHGSAAVPGNESAAPSVELVAALESNVDVSFASEALEQVEREDPRPLSHRSLMNCPNGRCRIVHSQPAPRTTIARPKYVTVTAPGSADASARTLTRLVPVVTRQRVTINGEPKIVTRTRMATTARTRTTTVTRALTARNWTDDEQRRARCAGSLVSRPLDRRDQVTITCQQQDGDVRESSSARRCRRGRAWWPQQTCANEAVAERRRAVERPEGGEREPPDGSPKRFCPTRKRSSTP
jgi:hypothetical protein